MMGREDITIRKAVVSDYEAIYRLNAELGYDYDKDETKKRLQSILGNEQYILFVAEVNGEVAGYIHGGDYHGTYSDPLKNILSFVVFEKCRHHGVGRMLITALEGWAKECGCAGVRLVSAFHRVGAHRFYEACGYTLRKEQKNFVKIFHAGNT
jgi:ribosomal protein S18 acetylase RimI-like enzyme